MANPETTIQVAYGLACECGCDGVLPAVHMSDDGTEQQEMFVLFVDPKQAMKEAVNNGTNQIKKVEIRVIDKESYGTERQENIPANQSV